MGGKNVDIFIWISTKAPKARKAEYKYTLIYNGKTLSGSGEERDITGHRLAMKAVIAALSRMRKPSVITIHTDCQYLVNGNLKLEEWSQNGWMRSDRKELKNVDLWKEIYELKRGHAIRVKKENVNLLLGENGIYTQEIRVEQLLKG